MIEISGFSDDFISVTIFSNIWLYNVSIMLEYTQVRSQNFLNNNIISFLVSNISLTDSVFHPTKLC